AEALTDIPGGMMEGMSARDLSRMPVAQQTKLYDIMSKKPELSFTEKENIKQKHKIAFKKLNMKTPKLGELNEEQEKVLSNFMSLITKAISIGAGVGIVEEFKPGIAPAVKQAKVEAKKMKE
ncbi:hypothetical protein LCGC14_3047430, partial [marine sediment metagenome]